MFSQYDTRFANIPRACPVRAKPRTVSLYSWYSPSPRVAAMNTPTFLPRISFGFTPVSSQGNTHDGFLDAYFPLQYESYLPASKIASNDRSSVRRCIGSIEVACSLNIPKKDASKRSMSGIVPIKLVTPFSPLNNALQNNSRYQ